MKNLYTKIIQIRIDEKTRIELEKYCQKKPIGMSELIRQAVRYFIKRDK